MERYINAGKLKAHYSWWENGSEEYQEFKQIFDTIIDVQPTADVVERKRGKCIRKEVHSNWSDWTEYTCSLCGTTFEQLYKANFCPNCGAEMEE